ncbi:hypothetical protein A0J48_015135 [Sphaerospermopsis aphanizomenoides BCCUSP55]|uniref:hypothetical protein n=1 Tax=Sphaerospermopsis aphanizomenoides TaxID=459663 RepID=UPI001906605F|nr:hypothetical protein [Sphaerospermopsis aphanizomenoides]MBK1988855.1 hypothetical protein [Sphaerospermopsis aphanizomenoides BCCUSP55]
MIRTYQVQVDQRFLLDFIEKVWLVKSGYLALFRTKFAAGESIVNRRYLFNVSMG